MRIEVVDSIRMNLGFGVGVSEQSLVKYPTCEGYRTLVASSFEYAHSFALKSSPVTGALTGCAAAYDASCALSQT